MVEPSSYDPAALTCLIPVHSGPFPWERQAQVFTTWKTGRSLIYSIFVIVFLGVNTKSQLLQTRLTNLMTDDTWALQSEWEKSR